MKTQPSRGIGTFSSTFLLSVLSLGVVQSGQGQVLFDFDTGTPTLTTGQALPPSQTAGGITASFSATSPSVGGLIFSVQKVGSQKLPGFSSLYLYDNRPSTDVVVLHVGFSQRLTGISLNFATTDNTAGGEGTATIQLTAYLDSTGTQVGNPATAQGTFTDGAAGAPGTLTFNSAQPFNLVEITVPSGQASMGFFVDNILVTPVPEPATYALVVGLGLGAAVPFLRRKQRHANV